jgi:hypothetical protein
MDTFTPDLTPRQMFLLGAFGGTYFRNIYSSIKKQNINGRLIVKKFKFLDGIKDDLLFRSDYNKDINKYKCKVGMSLEFWEKSGWIKKPDYYGWIQWYCNYYNGRRIKDYDDYQIKRWINVKKRFWNRRQNDKIKQILLHWCIKS